MSIISSIADMVESEGHIRFEPEADITALRPPPFELIASETGPFFLFTACDCVEPVLEAPF
jgi:hypothetical protein